MAEHVSTLDILSSVDGRDNKIVKNLQKQMSLRAYTENRVYFSIEYYNFISKLLKKHLTFEVPRFEHFGMTDEHHNEILRLDSIKKHDVVAIIKFLSDYYASIHANEYGMKFTGLIHFCLTSNDVNSYAYVRMLQDGIAVLQADGMDPFFGSMTKLIEQCHSLMPSRTHGQKAPAAKMSSKLMNLTCTIVDFWSNIIDIASKPMEIKMSGAIGEMNSFNFINKLLPQDQQIDFNKELDQFVEKLGFVREKHTTQISRYAQTIAILTHLSNIALKLTTLSKNLWEYIEHKYFKLKPVAGQAGSSTMSNKVNPVAIEKSVTCFTVTCALIPGIVRSIEDASLYDRTIGDSYATRQVGFVFAMFLIGVKNLTNDIDKLAINKEIMMRELVNNPQIIIEGVQLAMKFDGMYDAYDQTCDFSRGKDDLSLETIREFIKKQKWQNQHIFDELMMLSPETYV